MKNIIKKDCQKVPGGFPSQSLKVLTEGNVKKSNFTKSAGEYDELTPTLPIQKEEQNYGNLSLLGCSEHTPTALMQHIGCNDDNETPTLPSPSEPNPSARINNSECQMSKKNPAVIINNVTISSNSTFTKSPIHRKAMESHLYVCSPKSPLGLPQETKKHLEDENEDDTATVPMK